MGARHRLNSLYLIGVLAAAGLIGGAAESLGVFLIAAAVLTVLLVHGGDIRPNPGPPPRRRRR